MLTLAVRMYTFMIMLRSLPEIIVLTLDFEVIEWLNTGTRYWLSLVPLKLSIRGEHKPSRSPVLDVLTWGGELKTVYMYV